jgi:hypothetical protein
MPTVDQYAASIIEKYHVVANTGSPSHRAADELIPVLKQWAKQYLLGITLTGAYAKNTAITLSSDVDVLIALSLIPGMEMKKIFWSLFEFLTDQNLKAHTRTVSIQVPCKGLNVDLIPSCRDRNTSGNLLFYKNTEAEVHTDVAQHVHLIANSGRQQEICGLKIWRERNKLDFPSLYLELTVLQALQDERFGQLADNIHSVLRYLSRRFEEAVVRDPANSKNIISNDLSDKAKRAVAKTAHESLYDDNWKKILW